MTLGYQHTRNPGPYTPPAGSLILAIHSGQATVIDVDRIRVVADYSGATSESVIVDVESRAFYDSELHRMGPTSTLLWARLAQAALDGVESLDVLELAGWLGVPERVVRKSLVRLVRFGRIRHGDSPGTYSVLVTCDRLTNPNNKETQ